VAPTRGPEAASGKVRKPPRAAFTVTLVGGAAKAGAWVSRVTGLACDKDATTAAARTGVPTPGRTSAEVISGAVVGGAFGSRPVAHDAGTGAPDIGRVGAGNKIGAVVDAGQGGSTAAGVAASVSHRKAVIGAGSSARSAAASSEGVAAQPGVGVGLMIRAEPSAKHGSAGDVAAAGVGADAKETEPVGMGAKGGGPAAVSGLSGGKAAGGSTVDVPDAVAAVEVIVRAGAPWRDGRRRSGGNPAAARSCETRWSFSARAAAAARHSPNEAAAAAFVFESFLVTAACAWNGLSGSFTRIPRVERKRPTSSPRPQPRIVAPLFYP